MVDLLGFLLDGGAMRRTRSKWPVVASRSVTPQDRVDLKSTCEVVAHQHGLSLETGSNAICLSRRTPFSTTEYSVSTEPDGNVVLRATYAPTVLDRVLCTLMFASSFAVLYFARSWLSALPAPAFFALLTLLIVPVAVLLADRLRSRRFRQEVNHVAAAFAAPAGEKEPYRVASQVRVETDPSPADAEDDRSSRVQDTRKER